MTRVLLVEDNRDTGESISRAMRLRNVECEWAMTVADADNLYEVDRYDVIILDYELPDGTGLDFLPVIRGSDKAVTVLFSGLDRSRELAAAELTVDHQIGKNDVGKLLDLIEAAK